MRLRLERNRKDPEASLEVGTAISSGKFLWNVARGPKVEKRLKSIWIRSIAYFQVSKVAFCARNGYLFFKCKNPTSVLSVPMMSINAIADVVFEVGSCC